MKTPMVLMRGGTSKCVFLYERDIPSKGEERDAFLLSLMGSPDPRQIDGVGGATSLTSKVCIIGPSSRADADVDYTFGQVNVTAPLVDYGGNCGNCSSAVGPFAVDEGLVPPVEGITPVRVHNTNTHKILLEQVPTRGSRALYEGDYEIAGVPGTGARIRIWFMDPAGAVTGNLLPTGQVREEIDGVEVSIVDAANPLVFVRATDLGMRGTELPGEVDGNPRLLARIERIRGEAAVRCGLVGNWREASKVTPGIPKISMVSPAQDYHDIFGRPVSADDIDFTGRIMSMGRLHAAYALTGAVCTGIASRIEGSLVYEVARQRGDQVVFGHPSGAIDVEVRMDGARPSGVAVSRTARRLFEGSAYVRARAPR